MGRRDRVDCRARDLLFAGRTSAADNDPAPAAAVGRQPGRRGIAYGGPHRQGNRYDLRLIWPDLSSSITPLPRVFFTMMDLTQQTRARATRRAGSHGDDGSY